MLFSDVITELRFLIKLKWTDLGRNVVEIIVGGVWELLNAYVRLMTLIKVDCREVNTVFVVQVLYHNEVNNLARFFYATDRQ